MRSSRPGSAATPLGLIEHQLAWEPNGPIGRWIAGNPAMVLLDGTLFVHGGISPPYVHLPIAEINRQVDAALETKATDPQSIINAIYVWGRFGTGAWRRPTPMRRRARRTERRWRHLPPNRRSRIN